MIKSESNKTINIIREDFVYRCNLSANLVERFLEYNVDNTKNIKQILTIDDISFLDIFTSELAHYHFPQAFLKKKSHHFLIYKIKSFFTNKLLFVKSLFNFLLSLKKENIFLPQKSVFLLSFTNRMYVDILHPLATKLNNTKKKSTIFLFNDNLQLDEDLKLNDAIYYNITQLDIKKNNLEVSILRNKLIKSISKIDIDKCLKSILTKDEIVYFPYFKNLIQRFLYIYIPNIVKKVIITRNLLENQNPSIIISPDTADVNSRIFAILAKSKKIPYVEIQFGLAGEEAVEWRFSLANLIMVWGETSKLAISKQLGSDKKLIITGSPRHDFIKNYKPTNEFNSLTRNKKVVLLASTYHYKENNHVDISILRSMQLAISEAAQLNKNIFLIIKPHPHENVEETKALFKSNYNSLLLDKNTDIRKVILNCDVFISYGSTSTIDAIIANKLIICPIFQGWDFSSDIFKNSGATLNPQNNLEIIDIFKNINNGTYLDRYKSIYKNRLNFLEELAYKTDGNSSKRIIDVINNSFMLNI
jgi:hypothetical protein